MKGTYLCCSVWNWRSRAVGTLGGTFSRCTTLATFCTLYPIITRSNWVKRRAVRDYIVQASWSSLPIIS